MRISIFFLPFVECVAQCVKKILRAGDAAAHEVEMEHRAFRPFTGHEPVDCQAMKELAISSEIMLHGRYEQALAEASRPAEKIKLACILKLMDIHRLIDVGIPSADNFLKTRFTHRIFHKSRHLSPNYLSRGVSPCRKNNKLFQTFKPVTQIFIKKLSYC